ncbi:MAG TPA: GNAT family N-acetyltransferase [Thermoanaerobaculia bacterium]|nr:GNAT family N-acetyltransferase [Thermoanaerobaculia bacterium]
MTLTIRPAVPLDRERIHQILVTTAVFNQEEIDAAMELVDLAFRHSQRREYTVQVITGGESEDGMPLGYVCYGPTPRTEGVFDLYWIAVDPARQGQGLGQLLLRFVEGAVRKREGRMLLIETSSRRSNEPTIRFYRRSGYEEISRIKDFYRIKDDKVVFSKEL